MLGGDKGRKGGLEGREIESKMEEGKGEEKGEKEKGEEREAGEKRKRVGSED